ncbi:response regulator transcription factor [Streptomyces cocklensis]|uniref:Two component transcriptional regulator, LuxR family n=1 Tax=Actinacidiphila cocklensis TaxID=887465 RepID=A0A9W4DSB2_9ACTN|nr:response regulator transcription factor [Actinacidiphila cocklensis]MDD1064153.1 response regulator transcription factor [Actinacidiphila cocklensis]WSX75569.1 response regulator transcription factor [Streptomyces sp. NBC_00899]CAG6394674.1 Two component transcriptional regulator, LuxR family [Actinacidiphila cocklensis]
MPRIWRVAIVEQHALVRRGLTSLLSTSPRTRLAASVAEPGELAVALAEAAPAEPLGPAPHLDVIVLGRAARSDGTHDKVVEEVCGLGRVLVVADFADGRPVAAVLRAGAHGCVSRLSEEEDLLGAVETVARGGIHVDPALAGHFHAELRQPRAAAPPELARREVETLRWLAAGLTHRQIARRMELTEATVSTYVKRIRNKLGVGNKADLTRKAFELGVLPDPEEQRSTAGPRPRGVRDPAAA